MNHIPKVFVSEAEEERIPKGKILGHF